MNKLIISKVFFLLLLSINAFGAEIVDEESTAHIRHQVKVLSELPQDLNSPLFCNSLDSDNSFYKQTCGTASVVPAQTPSVFKSIPEESLKTQDENQGSYVDHGDFQEQLTRFLNTDNPGETKSRDSACTWLFWDNGVMRRPYAGTLCAISRNSNFIKKMATKYNVPPEYIACAIGGDSMIVHGGADFIANTKAGSARASDEFVLDLVQPSAFENKYKQFTFSGQNKVEQLIEKMAVIGQEAKQKYLNIYRRSDLNFGHEREAAILSTIYNKGVEKCNPNNSKEPILNYFGLSCSRMMKVYKLHLNSNPSSSSCI